MPDILGVAENNLPHLTREVFADQYRRLCELDRVIEAYDRKVEALAKTQEVTKRQRPLEGLGPLTAHAAVASFGDIREFRNRRQFAAWLEPVSRQRSSGGKARHGRITNRGMCIYERC